MIYVEYKIYKIKLDTDKCFKKKKPTDSELKKIEKDRKKLGVNMKKVEMAKKWHSSQEMRNFSDILPMLDLYFEDMIDCLNGNYSPLYTDDIEPNEALSSYCFSEYSRADSFYTLFQTKVEEDFKHISEEKWDIKNLKLMAENGYKIKTMESDCVFRKRIFMYILKEILCSIDEFKEKYETYYKMKNWFLFDGDVNFCGTDRVNKFKQYSIYDCLENFNDDELVEKYKKEEFEWQMVMFEHKPTRLVEIRPINYIVYKIKHIKKTVANMIKNYICSNNKNYTEQDIINITNEYNLTVKTNNGHDKLCNNILILMIRIMNKGDTHVEKHLEYLGNIYTITRNNRRIKKQGFIGSLDMYGSRLGIEKTPQELHKLLF